MTKLINHIAYMRMPVSLYDFSSYLLERTGFYFFKDFRR